MANGTHELSILKHRLFRYPVGEKGVHDLRPADQLGRRLRINDHVLNGTGDPDTIMTEEVGVAWP